jgi:rhodanese-related sulfurtransferase
MNLHCVLVFTILQLIEVSGNFSAIQDDSKLLSPAEFQKKVKSDPKAVILDVRTPGETSQGVIEGATLLDIYQPDFEKKVNALDKSKNYYVYCKAGPRSERASNLMRGKGFKNVYNLDGGILGWKEAGLKTVKPK